MIFGQLEKFALIIEPFLFLSTMNDYDCWCGFFIKNKKYISDYTITSNVQKESIQNGALNNLIDNEELFFMSIDKCFRSLVSHRYHNWVAETEEELMDKEWVDINYDEMIYSANLETSLYGTEKYNIFCIGLKDKVRLISYKKAETYFSISNLDEYDLTECIVLKTELKEIIKCIKDTKFSI